MAEDTKSADQDEERDEEQQDSAGSDEEDEQAKLAKEKEEERDQAQDKIKELEEGDPPADLEDWPDDAAKYETFGGAEGDHGYHEGPEEKLGPSSLRHHEDGSVSVAGDKVDDPDEYKSDPIPGGPTDPNASQDLTTEKIRDKQGRDLESEDDEDGNGESDEDSGDSEAKSDDDSESKSNEEAEQSS